MRADRPHLYIRITDRLEAGVVDGKRCSDDWRRIGLATAKAMTGANGARVSFLAETLAGPIRVCHRQAGKKFTQPFPS